MMEKVSGFIIVWKLRFHTIINAPRRVRENVPRHILFYYGIYPVEGIGVFRVPKNGDARNKKPPALRVETKRCTKKSPFRYNRVVQALL
ncbi:hypothetical protein [Gallintestinimicrobium sp.]|uniref:hypothetical protein n=1 Tax=Gallintestinimicrobium sp. TaxID=2981655 RepID=UPI00399277CD